MKVYLKEKNYPLEYIIIITN